MVSLNITMIKDNLNHNNTISLPYRLANLYLSSDIILTRLTLITLESRDNKMITLAIKLKF